MKTKVLFFARSFLAKYYSDIQSDIIEPIFVTMTKEEKEFLQNKNWKVYGCFEEEYASLPVFDYSPNYLKTSFNSDRFLCRFDLEKRKEILGKEISFWKKVFDDTSPAFLVNETVAIEMAEVMAIEAERRGIPFYTSLLGFLPNTFYWKPDPFSGRLDDLSKENISDDNIKLAEQYLANVREKQIRPFYVSAIKKHRISPKTVIHSMLSHLRERRKIRRKERNQAFCYEDYSIFTAAGVRRNWDALFHSYDSINTIDDKHFVFFPMHLEPEATLNYFVDENYEQTSIIKLLACSIKQNQILVVKEHPQQQGALLSKTYCDLKKKYSNVVFLPSYISSFDLLKQCDAVVTLTSTAAWEGAILGKPVFVLGKIFYDQCPGVNRIESLKQLKQELRKKSYIHPESEGVRCFAAQMISRFHTGCPTPSFKENTIQSYVKAIEELVVK